ncbi:hypothetical protein TWF694_004408 [Orbilia ellipsospora]|uniref:Uncharacterized protein n=1 Tax=Orbilia ellipsospora TaxID=2528407 RepID=A0AAV9WV61_9PEZI
MTVCILLFGSSTSISMAITARCCISLLSGNVRVLRTVVAELVPEKELQPQVFGFLPNLFIAGMTFTAFCFGLLFLGETLEEMKQRYDPAREIRRNIEAKMEALFISHDGDALPSKSDHYMPPERRQSHDCIDGYKVNDEENPILSSRGGGIFDLWIEHRI